MLNSFLLKSILKFRSRVDFECKSLFWSFVNCKFDNSTSPGANDSNDFEILKWGCYLMTFFIRVYLCNYLLERFPLNDLLAQTTRDWRIPLIKIPSIRIDIIQFLHILLSFALFHEFMSSCAFVLSIIWCIMLGVTVFITNVCEEIQKISMKVEHFSSFLCFIDILFIFKVWVVLCWLVSFFFFRFYFHFSFLHELVVMLSKSCSGICNSF